MGNTGLLGCSWSVIFATTQHNMKMMNFSLIVMVMVMVFLPSTFSTCVDCDTFLGCLITCRNRDTDVYQASFTANRRSSRRGSSGKSRSWNPFSLILDLFRG